MVIEGLKGKVNKFIRMGRQVPEAVAVAVDEQISTLDVAGD